MDRYDDAPAMRVTPRRAVIDMLDGDALDRLVAEIQPALIVPEVERIRIERLAAYEEDGIRVVPTARAVRFTMDRRAIRDLAARDLGLRTAPYAYAATLDDLREKAAGLGFPCVVKPLMSSSGKGQSVVRTAEDLEAAWNEAHDKGRGDAGDVIVEGFLDFAEEITLLTVTQHDGPTRFAPAIGHIQVRGDYRESWQPCPLAPDALAEAERMAGLVTKALGGAGLWGVEFFVMRDGSVVFSELSPRPHDTGMVTLAGTQTLDEFALHARAILGLPIPPIELLSEGASAVLLGDTPIADPVVTGVAEAMSDPGVDVRVFGKPESYGGRRMAVALARGENARERARAAAAKLGVAERGA